MDAVRVRVQLSGDAIHKDALRSQAIDGLPQLLRQAAAIAVRPIAEQDTSFRILR